jgi:hypothetical protein
VKQKILYLPLLGSLLLLLGCTQAAIEAVNYEPVIDQPAITTAVVSSEVFAEYTAADFRLTAALFEYNNVLALSLEIRNLTGEDLSAGDYSISMTDGRDRKPIIMLSRQDLISTKAKVAGTGGSGPIQDQLIQATVDTLMNTINQPTKEKLIRIIDQGIDNYFSFRPVYANERRGGVLCFVPDFKLEFPLAVTVKINQEPYVIKFLPRQKAS